MILSISALKVKFRSIKQILGREANIVDGLKDLLRLNRVYGFPFTQLVAAKVSLDGPLAMDSMDVAEMVKSLAHLGEEKVRCSSQH